jgi:hypothetical protein
VGDLDMTRRRPVLIGCGAARAVVRILFASAVTWCAGTMAAAATDLYRTQTVVTGQGEANRMLGFASSLEDVLIKVSGAQKLAGDRRLAAYKSNAKSFVRAFSYRDQFAGKPVRDEQGTRDRPPTSAASALRCRAQRRLRNRGSTAPSSRRRRPRPWRRLRPS